jgi:hypothetical protein
MVHIRRYGALLIDDAQRATVVGMRRSLIDDAGRATVVGMRPNLAMSRPIPLAPPAATGLILLRTNRGQTIKRTCTSW